MEKEKISVHQRRQSRSRPLRQIFLFANKAVTAYSDKISRKSTPSKIFSKPFTVIETTSITVKAYPDKISRKKFIQLMKKCSISI